MSELIDHLKDVFEALGPVRARRMFRGHGIYFDDLMFALVVDEMLYLKTDEANAADFQAQGLVPFEYERRGKLVKLSFYAAPSEIFDDSSLAARWGRSALQAAARTKARTGKADSSRARRRNP